MNETILKTVEVVRKNGEKVSVTLTDLGTNGPVNRWKISTSYGGGSAARSLKGGEKKFYDCVKYFLAN